MNYNLFSIISSKLKNSQIKSICLLKDKKWKFGIKSQIKWYKKNIKKNDIHNLFYIKSKLVGYTLLRKRTYEIRSLNKRTNYLLFDTLIIDKKYRGKKLSNLLMNFNNTIINQSGYFSFLICERELISFYKKNKWIKVNNKNINIIDHLFSSNGMIFNMKDVNKKKHYFYVNK
ncbi:hypothetical protein N8784_01900 [Candidatus Pelagibacter sp.]|jgi:hypothetical protein|nr:hypothetical protein [Candidatus Pelagibacter sp.]